ncbi:hypothetical protein J3R30DRAFT_3700028 [Lentinula aciculospora]|uniref:Uncharacterized protein n=1 Tax=Lentinula aciculospora TaxID=153920 RepID=A0A9W9AGX0_9AGAR|nr:hypothetical protein J3R30DRAFT_3700028 [Lentinula aciculospora]
MGPLLKQNRMTLHELHFEGSCFQDPGDLLASLQSSKLQSLRELTFDGQLTASGSWVDIQALNPNPVLLPGGHNAIPRFTRAQLQALSLRGLGVLKTELFYFVQNLFATKGWSTYLPCTVWNYHYKFISLWTTGLFFRLLHLPFADHFLLYSDGDISNQILDGSTMHGIPVLGGLSSDVFKNFTQLQSFSLICKDSSLVIHNFVDHLSSLSSLEHLQITLVKPELDWTPL